MPSCSSFQMCLYMVKVLHKQVFKYIFVHVSPCVCVLSFQMY